MHRAASGAIIELGKVLEGGREPRMSSQAVMGSDEARTAWSSTAVTHRRLYAAQASAVSGV